MKQLSIFTPGSRDDGLGSHEEEEHDEGADHVGVKHFISDLGELNKNKVTCCSSFKLFRKICDINFLILRRSTLPP